VLSVVASLLVVPAGLLWGTIYVAFGEASAARFPFAYSLLSLIDLALLLRLRRYRLFRHIQQILIFALPVALQCSSPA
jgi:hypothetical protein